MDSPDIDRNPSPPPELKDLGAECIGSTAFSKHWLFSTLMKLIEEVDKENESQESEQQLVVDVDEELQNELCKLWDMSMNAEVALFLLEFKGVEILTGIIKKSNAPRVTEICVGILGNMACEDGVCKFMSEQTEVIDLVFMLLEGGDAPTLVEVTRLIYTSLSHVPAQNAWINAVKRSEEFLGHLMFILQSSTNCDLLKNTAELVDTLLDLEPNLCVSWATDEFVRSLLEAIQQIGCSHSEALEVYLHIFQSLSTTEPGVESLVAYVTPLEEKLSKYLNIVCEYEIVGLDGKEAGLASAFSVLHILFMLPDCTAHTARNLAKDEKTMRIFLKILEPLHPLVHHMKSSSSVANTNQSNNNIHNQQAASDPIRSQEIDHVTDNSQSSSEKKMEDKNNVSGNQNNEDKDFENLKMLFDVLSTFIVDFCTYLFKDSESERAASSLFTESSGSTEEKEKGDNSKCETKADLPPLVDCFPILDYLNGSCSRSRINYLMLTLRETQSDTSCLLDNFLDAAIKHKMNRLERIINDVNVGRIVTRAESANRVTSTDEKNDETKAFHH